MAIKESNNERPGTKFLPKNEDEWFMQKYKHRPQIQMPFFPGNSTGTCLAPFPRNQAAGKFLLSPRA